jgi:hypothetical protein
MGEPWKPRKCSPARSGLRGYWECRAAHVMAKAYVDIPALELMDVDLPGVAGGGMSGWNVQQKPGTSRGLSKLSRNGEGSTYKSQCDEVVLCLRVGRMGPIK